MRDRTATRRGLRVLWVALVTPLFLAGGARAQEPPVFNDEPVQVHAFVSQGYIQSTENNYLAKSKRGSFEFTEVGVNVTKTVTDNLRVGLQLFTRDLGPTGNYTTHFDWFYLDYRFWDWLGVRAGRTKLPFGLFNETSDIDAARVPILLPQSVYPTQNRDFLLAQTGIELYGDVPLGDAGSLEYRGYGGTIFLNTTSAAATSTTTTVDVPYLGGGRLMWATPLEGLRLGASAQAMRLDVDFTLGSDTVTALKNAGTVPANFTGLIKAKLPAVLAVASIEYAAQDLLLATEYSRWTVDIESNVPAVLPNSHVVSERMYAMAAYRVTPHFSPGLYYSVLYPNIENRSGRENQQHDLAVTLRYDVNDNLLLKLEGHYMHGTAGVSPALNNNKPQNQLAETWGVLLAKTTAYF